MNETEAGKIVLTMQAAWPGFAEDDGANTMWLTIVARSEAVIGAQACKQLVNHLKFKPTIADWNEAIRSVHRYTEPGTVRAELGYPSEPMDPNTAKRTNAEFKMFQVEREQRRKSMTPEDFIRSEGHDPETHWLNPSGFVLRKVRGRVYQ